MRSSSSSADWSMTWANATGRRWYSANTGPRSASAGLGSRAHIIPDDDDLRDLGVPVHWVNRGGGCILHLPGQLSAYLAVPLPLLGLDLQGYLDRLNQAILGVLAEFDLRGTTRPDALGVDLGSARVATVGIAVNRWIAYHGLTLNVGSFLEPFEMLLDEPGFDGQPLRQTSMEAKRQRPVPMSKVREALIRQIEGVFGVQQHHFYTQHPLIGRKVRAYVYAQSLG